MNILFTCGGRRNYLIAYFKEVIQQKGKIIVVDSDNTAPALADADIAIQTPLLYDSDYLNVLNQIISSHEVDIVIPLNDLELPIMSKNKAFLESTGAKIIVSSPEVIDFCGDKWKTYNFFKNLKIKTPLSFIKIDEVVKAISNRVLDFPIIVKPRWGSGSLGIIEVNNEEELYSAHKLLSSKIERSSIANLHNDSDSNTIIFQQKIIGQEYGVDILNDFNGKFQNAFVRKKLAMRAGETDKAVSVVDDKFIEIAKKIGEATDHIGIMDCDFFVMDNDIYFLEMNPRFGGGYPFSHEAGINIPAIYLGWIRGESNTTQYMNYEAGHTFSKYDRIVKVNNQVQKANILLK